MAANLPRFFNTLRTKFEEVLYKDYTPDPANISRILDMMVVANTLYPDPAPIRCRLQTQLYHEVRNNGYPDYPLPDYLCLPEDDLKIIGTLLGQVPNQDLRDVILQNVEVIREGDALAPQRVQQVIDNEEREVYQEDLLYIVNHRPDLYRIVASYIYYMGDLLSYLKRPLPNVGPPVPVQRLPNVGPPLGQAIPGANAPPPPHLLAGANNPQRQIPGANAPPPLHLLRQGGPNINVHIPPQLLGHPPPPVVPIVRPRTQAAVAPPFQGVPPLPPPPVVPERVHLQNVRIPPRVVQPNVPLILPQANQAQVERLLDINGAMEADGPGAGINLPEVRYYLGI